MRALGITPACAGNTAGGAPDLRCNRDHPRLRGEYLFQRYNGLHSAGSPPLARGILTMLMIQDGIEGITPACAGNTRLNHPHDLTPRDHPRLRGEYFQMLLMGLGKMGSPPLARGIRSRYRWTTQHGGITPACAGNTLKESLIYSIFPLSAAKFHLVSHILEMS